MPSFFANPFMTPFMPQAAVSAIPVGSNSGTVESTQLTGPESGDYRSNPLQTGNYVMQSLQCQEMMQHYIQSLIAAASHLPGSNMSSDGATATTKNQLPLLLQRSLDDSREQSSGDSGHFQIDFPNALPALIQSMQQQLYLNNPAVSQYANSIPNLETNLTTSNVIRKIDDEKEKVNESKSFTMNDDASEEIRCEPQQMNDCNVALPEQQNGIINTDEISQDNENNHSVDIPSSNNVGKCSSSKNDENLMKEENTKKGKNSEIMIKELSSMNSSKISETIPFKTSTSSSSSSIKNIPETSLSSSSNGNNDTSTVQEECRTSVLIKKQMNEIDKEINRRIQNRNIKKVYFEFRFRIEKYLKKKN
ncbi:unnamed protein product [Onchocerca flexuosa]|uniref:Uncharacterized protein n=1 Tax=Onchocerca flexuosa TaxID=387005 RepID=A0A183H3M0_9BILA|nr:unnamed protein product [Onchocerca flexuosa]